MSKMAESQKRNHRPDIHEIPVLVCDDRRQVLDRCSREGQGRPLLKGGGEGRFRGSQGQLQWRLQVTHTLREVTHR